jgi:hypothetical protein
VSRPSPPKRRSAVICKEEVEAVIDADTERLVSPDLGGAGPIVCLSGVV